MKNYICRLIIIVITVIVIFNTGNFSYASERGDSPNIYINNQSHPLMFTESRPVHIFEQELYVPVRDFIQYIGGYVDWNYEISSIIVTFENSEILNLVKTDDELKFISNIAYLPLNFLIKKLELEVSEDRESFRIITREQLEMTEQNQMPIPEAFTPFVNNEGYLKSNPMYALDSEGVLTYNYSSNYFIIKFR